MEKITLFDEEIDCLNNFVKKGKKSGRELTRAQSTGSLQGRKLIKICQSTFLLWLLNS